MSTEEINPVAAAVEKGEPTITESKPLTSESTFGTGPVAQTPVSKPEEKQALSTSSPLSKLFSELPSIISAAEYGEMWGVKLKDEKDVPTGIVLEKFLRANQVEKKKNVDKAKAQLIEALKWRKTVQPRKLLEETEFDGTRFGGLGYVTFYPQKEGKEIVTWNIYGGVKDKVATFGNIEA